MSTICPSCLATTKPVDAFCPACGAHLATLAAALKQSSQNAAPAQPMPPVAKSKAYLIGQDFGKMPIGKFVVLHVLFPAAAGVLIFMESASPHVISHRGKPSLSLCLLLISLADMIFNFRKPLPQVTTTPRAVLASASVRPSSKARFRIGFNRAAFLAGGYALGSGYLLGTLFSSLLIPRQ